MEKKEPLATQEEYEKQIIYHEDIPAVELVPGQIKAHLISGERATAMFATFQPNVVGPLHKHEHEQIMIIADGEGELVTGGKRYPVKKGDVTVFASNQEHGTYASDKGIKTIEIFIPVRQEYMDKLAALKKSLGK
ncbi:MAG: cupin domain-containing protein [Dehalococcoidia bacterium]|nr:cupin domain-containing protein [Dehalococcoidia bacterium]